MTDFSTLTSAMRACEQAPGLSVLAHGYAVNKRYRQIIEHVRDGAPLRGDWRLPDWAGAREFIDHLLPDDVMARYQVFHDCGKPETLVVDADGRRHFPGHADASERVFRAAGGDDLTARLIGMDMDIHLLKDAGVAEFAARPEAISLLLTGLAEIHANAEMFGGMDSVSFKMKWKQINKRGRAILKSLPFDTALADCA